MKTLLKRAVRFLKRKVFQDYYMKPCRKFVIITTARSGSNLLVDLLDSHPNITCHGELFKFFNQGNPSTIWDTTFKLKSKSKYYVGFKIFYDHPLDSDDDTIWNLIQRDKTIKVIHLVRNNMLKTYVSLQIAYKVDVWKSKEDIDPILVDDKRVHIDIASCFKEFKRIEDAMEKTRRSFKHHDFIEITYEDLTHTTEAVTGKLFEHLGLAGFTVTSNLKKQNNESLESLIVNYKPLKDVLETTTYARFLD